MRLTSSALAISSGLLLVAISATNVKATYAENSSEPIYSCEALGDNFKRQYIVDQLKRSGDSFDVAIYEGGGGDNRYVGTVTIKATKQNGGIVGIGKTYDGTIEISALQRFTTINVQDSVTGYAFGKCFRNWQMADNNTRKLIRQCFALAARKYGSIAEVTRNGCIGDPSGMIEEIQR